MGFPNQALVLDSSKLLLKEKNLISHGIVSWTTRKALHWGVIYMLKITEELCTKVEKQERHLSARITLESLLCYSVWCSQQSKYQHICCVFYCSINQHCEKSSGFFYSLCYPEIHNDKSSGNTTSPDDRTLWRQIVSLLLWESRKTSSYKAESIMWWFIMTIFFL